MIVKSSKIFILICFLTLTWQVGAAEKYFKVTMAHWNFWPDDSSNQNYQIKWTLIGTSAFRYEIYDINGETLITTDREWVNLTPPPSYSKAMNKESGNPYRIELKKNSNADYGTYTFHHSVYGVFTGKFYLGLYSGYITKSDIPPHYKGTLTLTSGGSWPESYLIHDQSYISVGEFHHIRADMDISESQGTATLTSRDDFAPVSLNVGTAVQVASIPSIPVSSGGGPKLILQRFVEAVDNWETIQEFQIQFDKGSEIFRLQIER